MSDSPSHVEFWGDWILQPILSYLYCAVAWSSELFVFRCGLEFRAIYIALWLGVPSYLFFDVASSFYEIAVSSFVSFTSACGQQIQYLDNSFIFSRLET